MAVIFTFDKFRSYLIESKVVYIDPYAMDFASSRI